MGRFLVALLALSSSCLSSVLAADGVKTLDGFLDESSRMALLQEVSSRHLAEGNAGGRPSVPVDRSLFAKLRSLLSPSEAYNEAVEGSSVVPSKRSLSGYGLHKDHLPDGSLVDGMVGVVYLEGQGTMVFTHDHTGTEHAVDVQPGRMIAWDNRLFTHKLVAPLNGPPRSMLGPMAAAGSRLLPVGLGGGPVIPPPPPASPPNCTDGGYVTGRRCRPKVTVRRIRVSAGRTMTGDAALSNELTIEFTVTNASPDSVDAEEATVTVNFPVDIESFTLDAADLANGDVGDKFVTLAMPKLDGKASLTKSFKVKLDNEGLRSYGKMVITTRTDLEQTVAHGPSTFATFKALSA